MKKNLPLIIGIALPVVFIIAISIIIFMPNVFVKPSHDFIYSNEAQYYAPNQYQMTYAVIDGKIVESKSPAITDPNIIKYQYPTPTLYVYTVKDDSTHQITFTEAKKYDLDPGPTSSDGYVVSYSYSNNGLFELFGSNGNDSGYFVSKGTGKRKLTGLIGDRGSFKFIGWIK